MKLIFLGTPDFAVPCLDALIQAGHGIACVFTQPDKPKGRGYKLAPPPVKEKALSYQIPVYQYPTLRDGQAYDLIRSVAPDAIVVVAYGKILPPDILALPPCGCVNVHASLLPKFRGAAPIQWAIYTGETETGVTTMRMDEGMDTGDIYLTEKTPIGPEETAGELHDRLADMGAKLLVETLSRLEEGAVTPVKQDHTLATHAPIIKKSMALIDWSRPAREIHDQIRAFQPWPVAYTDRGKSGKILKVYRSRVVENYEKAAPGERINSPGRLIFSTGDGCIELLEVQIEGGKRLPAADFLRGIRD